MNDLFLLIIEIIGTMAFAISGIRLAAAKSFDWFGAYSAGLVTAIGGGTMRDVLLNTTPFWMNSGWYLAVTGLSLAIVIVFKKYLVKLNQTFLLFDTIGLALFVVIGIRVFFFSPYNMREIFYHSIITVINFTLGNSTLPVPACIIIFMHDGI